MEPVINQPSKSKTTAFHGLTSREFIPFVDQAPESTRSVVIANPRHSMSSRSSSLANYQLVDQLADDYSSNTAVTDEEFNLFLEDIKPVIKVLQVFGIFPRRRQTLETNTIKRGFFNALLQQLGLIVLSLVNLTTMLFSLTMATYVFRNLFQEVGLWQPITVMSAIMGLKPLQAGMNVMIFSLKSRNHIRLLLQLQKKFVRIIITTLVMAWIVTTLIRILDAAIVSIVGSMDYGENMSTNCFNNATSLAWYYDLIFDYATFLILPLISILQFLPLIYYISIGLVIRRWLTILHTAMRHDPHLEKNSLEHYYRQFLLVSGAQALFGKTFNPFVMFSLALSVITFCLTLYFATQARAFPIPPCPVEQVFFFVNSIWSVAQIAILLCYAFGILITGFKINEMSRSILGEALEMHITSEADQYYMFCIAQKIRAQASWGIAVWKGFLIERSLMFSIAGMILTYCMILLRLKPDKNLAGGYCTPKSVTDALRRHLMNYSAHFGRPKFFT